ncbi:MAG: hypothetical protein COC01_07380 [Bacteroidetes bacterium]|nr:DUF1801 domain-containing protein [Bacteroidia bacterium]PCH66728.1 MAG: hypothetical protein COC01_07380 [Bacteroidota bacterium]
MAEQKTKATEKSVNDFINAIPNEKKRNDGFVILDMMKQITKLEPKMWGPSIIGFGTYHYIYDSGHEGDAPLLGFSPRKQKIVLYVLTNFTKQQKLLQKLGKHTTGKVCLYINKLEDINIEILEQIIVASWVHAKNKYE